MMLQKAIRCLVYPRQKSGHDPIGGDTRGRGRLNAGGGYAVRPTIY